MCCWTMVDVDVIVGRAMHDTARPSLDRRAGYVILLSLPPRCSYYLGQCVGLSPTGDVVTGYTYYIAFSR